MRPRGCSVDAIAQDQDPRRPDVHCTGHTQRVKATSNDVREMNQSSTRELSERDGTRGDDRAHVELDFRVRGVCNRVRGVNGERADCQRRGKQRDVNRVDRGRNGHRKVVVPARGRHYGGFGSEPAAGRARLKR